MTKKRNDLSRRDFLKTSAAVGVGATAAAGLEAGRAPPDLTPWLPWSMEPARRQRFQQPRASPVHG